MYEVRKSFEISAAHRLSLDYESKCSGLHGHNWQIEVACKSNELDQNGMVVDFTHIKKVIEEQLDHKDICEFVVDGQRCNPTAENIARWIAEQIGDKCFEVKVEESKGNLAIWRAD